MAALPDLTIRQLQTFREVMRAGSISEASRALGRTQPAVSSMIAGIEQALGFRLFIREHGRLTPCPEAHYFLEEAESVLERLDRAQRVMTEFSGLERGNLRIACHPAASSRFVPEILTAFLSGRDEVKADLMMRSSQVVEDLIASQQYDIGLAEPPAPRTSILSETFNLRCVLALPENDPLAARTVVTPAEIGDAPLAMLFDAHPITEATRAAFRAAGRTANRRFTLRTFLPAMELVAAGLCLAIVDRITAATSITPGIAFRELAPALPSNVSILIPAHRPVSQITRAFHRDLRDGLMALGSIRFPTGSSPAV